MVLVFSSKCKAWAEGETQRAAKCDAARTTSVAILSGGGAMFAEETN